MSRRPISDSPFGTFLKCVCLCVSVFVCLCGGRIKVPPPVTLPFYEPNFSSFYRGLAAPRRGSDLRAVASGALGDPQIWSVGCRLGAGAAGETENGPLVTTPDYETCCLREGGGAPPAPDEQLETARPRGRQDEQEEGHGGEDHVEQQHA